MMFACLDLGAYAPFFCSIQVLNYPQLRKELCFAEFG